MAWETALDRLVLRQIHLAERGEARASEVSRQLEDLHELAPDRDETAYHHGYANALLGLELPTPEPQDAGRRRFFRFGAVRGHERRGEREWVANLLGDQAVVMDLLTEPRIAVQVLPLVMRTLFWSGDLTVAVRAIDFLSSVGTEDGPTDSLVEAALADLLSRLETREDSADRESTAEILQRCISLPCFAGLPAEVRAGYLSELGHRLLAISEFEPALEQYRAAFELASDTRFKRSQIALGAAMATMRLHGVQELEPRVERGERDEARAWIERVGEGSDLQVPEALFTLGLFDYETGNHLQATERFDECVQGCRRVAGRDAALIARNEFFLAASLLILGDASQSSRALRLMESALAQVRPDLETFYAVHEELKKKDRRLSLRFLDSVDIGRGTAPDQLLLVALEYLSLGEADPALRAAERVLQVAVDLDQRVEAMRVLLTAHNMQGRTNEARGVYQEIRDLLVQRGAFSELEKLLLTEDFVGQALDHLEIKCELVAVYEEMEDRDFERAQLQSQVARSLRARKDVESLQEAEGLLREVEIGFPELVREDLEQIQGLLRLADVEPESGGDGGRALCAELAAALGHAPRILVVGGNERQRRHHPRFEELATDWGFDGEWLMANYSSPQKLVGEIADRLDGGRVDVLMLLHWNRHETTEPALEAARKAEVPARTVHYAGFTSLQVALSEQLGRLRKQAPEQMAGAGAGGGRGKGSKGR